MGHSTSTVRLIKKSKMNQENKLPILSVLFLAPALIAGSRLLAPHHHSHRPASTVSHVEHPSIYLGISNDEWSGGYDMSVQFCNTVTENCCEVSIGDTSPGQTFEKNKICEDLSVDLSSPLTVEVKSTHHNDFKPELVHFKTPNGVWLEATFDSFYEYTTAPVLMKEKCPRNVKVYRRPPQGQNEGYNKHLDKYSFYSMEPSLINGRNHYTIDDENEKYGLWFCGSHWIIGDSSDRGECKCYAFSTLRVRDECPTPMASWTSSSLPIHCTSFVEETESIVAEETPFPEQPPPKKEPLVKGFLF